MPELPEVETTMRGLKPILLGKQLERVVVIAPKLRMPLDKAGLQALAGKKITHLTRRAKYILVGFEYSQQKWEPVLRGKSDPKNKGQTLLLHLGMSGRLCTFSADYIPQKHDHFLLYTNAGQVVVLNDPRRFGEVSLIGIEDPRLVKLGIEPLGNDLTPTALQGALKSTAQPIKNALLDQNRIAGLGNIYVCEALFLAAIHPARSANALTAAEAKRLVPAIQHVLTAAIEAGGSSLRDYVHTSGQLGFFQNQFKVYGRTGQACVKCQQPIQQLRQSGRSTFYCGQCQQ